MDAIYVTDTSSWIELGQYYPQDTFTNLWDHLQSLIKDGRIISPEEVLKEISPKKGPEIYRWCYGNKKMFAKNNSEILSIVSTIMANHQQLVNPNKIGAAADPFVIALARSRLNNIAESKVMVVSQENAAKKDRIPFVCRAYGLECIRLVDLFQREKWRF